MEKRSVPKTRKGRANNSQIGNFATQSGNVVALRFTGAAGGTHYVYSGQVLRKGDTIVAVPLEGHWARLVESGDAEVVA